MRCVIRVVARELAFVCREVRTDDAGGLDVWRGRGKPVLCDYGRAYASAEAQVFLSVIAGGPDPNTIVLLAVNDNYRETGRGRVAVNARRIHTDAFR